MILDEPTTEIYASQVAAPLFGELAGWTLRHYRVSPGVDVVIEEAPDPGIGRVETAVEPESVSDGPEQAIAAGSGE